MDKTPQYIAMASCAEIQDGWKPKVGDYTQKGIITDIEHDLIWVCVDMNWHNKADLIWLPYQHQLQNMITGDLFGWPRDAIDAVDRLDMFYGFVGNLKNAREMSMEQLWLRYVMHELHQKSWSGIETGWTK